MLPSSCGSVCLPACCPAQIPLQDSDELAAACAAQLPPTVSGPPADAGPPSCSPHRALPISSDALYSHSFHGLPCLGVQGFYKLILPVVLLEKAKNPSCKLVPVLKIPDTALGSYATVKPSSEDALFRSTVSQTKDGAPEEDHQQFFKEL